MNYEALRNQAYWESSDHGSVDAAVDSYECGSDARPASPKPIRTYSKRASSIHEIRRHSKWATAHADDDLVPPTQAAQVSAAYVINQLPEGCLDFKLAISHSGEINLFYGSAHAPFQMLIDEDGFLSYFGKFGEDRFAGSDLSPEQFPYLRLLCLLGGN